MLDYLRLSYTSLKLCSVFFISFLSFLQFGEFLFLLPIFPASDLSYIKPHLVDFKNLRCSIFLALKVHLGPDPLAVQWEKKKKKSSFGSFFYSFHFSHYFMFSFNP